VSLLAGSAVLTQGAESTGFYIVQTGELEVLVRAADGSERLLSTLSPGEFFGETALPSILALFRADDQSIQALVEPEAVHCGICKPRGRPLRLDGLEAWVSSQKPDMNQS
jgi:hypothetical protein